MSAPSVSGKTTEEDREYEATTSCKQWLLLKILMSRTAPKVSLNGQRFFDCTSQLAT